MAMIAFDTETVEGEPLTVQFGDANQTYLFYVSRETICETFLEFLRTHGESGFNLAWAHNLEYDWGIIFIEAPWIWKTRKDHIERTLTNGARVEVAYHNLDNPFHHLHIGDQYWLILDTRSFIKRSLEQACELLRLPIRKLPRPSYLGTRAPTPAERPAFELYARNDAGATYILAQYLVDRHREFGIGPSISIAQMAALVVRSKFLHRDSTQPLRTQVRTLSPTVVAQRKQMLRERIRVVVGSGIPFCETKPGSNALLEASCLTFHGGKNRIYVPPGVYEDVIEVDIVSAYPHAMTALPPLTRGRWRRVWEYDPAVAGIYKVRGSVKGSCPYGVFMDISGKHFYRNGCFETWVTGWELASAWHEIILDAIDDGYVWWPASDATNPFADYVNFFFQKKQETSKEDPRYEMYKLLMNSVYGKLTQLTDDVDTSLGIPQRVAGGLFNPFWASQITGHTRARLHTLEHEYSAFHSSTDSILTRATSIPTGSQLGGLEVKARGRLVILRKRLYFIVDDQGHVLKKALHAFYGKSARGLFAVLLRGGGAYKALHMVRPREALRSKDGQKPFRMTTRRYRLHLPATVFRSVVTDWRVHQERRLIPFP